MNLSRACECLENTHTTRGSARAYEELLRVASVSMDDATSAAVKRAKVAIRDVALLWCACEVDPQDKEAYLEALTAAFGALLDSVPNLRSQLKLAYHKVINNHPSKNQFETDRRSSQRPGRRRSKRVQWRKWPSTPASVLVERPRFGPHRFKLHTAFKLDISQPLVALGMSQPLVALEVPLKECASAVRSRWSANTYTSTHPDRFDEFPPLEVLFKGGPVVLERCEDMLISLCAGGDFGNLSFFVSADRSEGKLWNRARGGFFAASLVRGLRKQRLENYHGRHLWPSR